jgi:serine/threonine protein kinase
MFDPLQVLGTTVASKYDVVEFLSRRGARVAYRALHRAWGEPVFLEFALLDPSTDPAVLEAQRRGFTRSGATVARLCSRSTAVPHTRDGGTYATALGELPYAVSEWIEGTTVEVALDKARRTGRERFPPELVTEWFDPVMDALVLAHGDGIVHGHLGPETLMVTGGSFGSRGQIKITGMVDAAWRKSLPAGALPFVPPPPGYAAPELGAGDPSLLGPWTDVFGIASVMVHLVTGTVDRGQWVARLQRELRFSFDKALATRIDERFKSVSAFRAALEEAVDSTESGRHRNPRRTMVVSEQSNEQEASAGAFESSGRHDTAPPPAGPARPPRVRLAFTQPAMVVPEDLLQSSPEVPLVDEPAAGQTMPAMPRPAPVPGRPSAVVPLLVFLVVLVASGGVAFGYFVLQ